MNGNPYLSQAGTDPVPVDATVVATVDAQIPTVELVEDHMYIGVQTLDYDAFSPVDDEDDDDDE